VFWIVIEISVLNERWSIFRFLKSNITQDTKRHKTSKPAPFTPLGHFWLAKGWLRAGEGLNELHVIGMLGKIAFHMRNAG
tara:strand:- start:245 stop:484 length:240 start_codon:yes stop_codon:yes gene_type:complete